MSMEKETSPVQQIGRYSLVTPGECGWDRFNLLKSTLFRRAVLCMAAYGIAAGLFWYLFNMQLIDIGNRMFFNHVATLSLFVGGLYISGNLAVRSTPLIAVFLVVSCAWQYFFYDNDQLKIYGVVCSSWLYLWWVWKEPEMMEEFGLRKKHFFSDTLKALLLLGIVLAYSMG